MPRDITHVILADKAAEIINSKVISENIDAFHMGCIADDSFLYTLSPKLSSKLHGMFRDDTRIIVLEMMKELKKEKDSKKWAEKKAFICGYLCHMAADATFHPLIYSISGSHFNKNSKDEIELSKACHRYTETWLDLYFMKAENKTFKNFRPFRKIVTQIGMRLRLDDFFTDCFQNVLKAKKYTWGDNFDLQSQFHNGMTRQIFIDKITQNQTMGKMLRKLDGVLNGKLKLYVSGFYDLSRDIPLRLMESSFIHPVTKQKVSKSLKDLENDTVCHSVLYIRAVDDYLKFGSKEAFFRAVPNNNLDTGVEDTGHDVLRNGIIHSIFEEMKGRVKNKKNARLPLGVYDVVKSHLFSKMRSKRD